MINMLKVIMQSVNEFSFKNQRFKETHISSIIKMIDDWMRRSKKVKLDLNVINLSTYDFDCEDLFDFIKHYKIVERVDLIYPIILNNRWEIIDWRHRLVKAVIEWKKSIKWIPFW